MNCRLCCLYCLFALNNIIVEEEEEVTAKRHVRLVQNGSMQKTLRISKLVPDTISVLH